MPISSEIDALNSITLYEKTETRKILIHLQFLPTTECKTFTEYSSCDMNTVDSKLSSVKTLISNLKGGEKIEIGCNLTTIQGFGNTKKYFWSVSVLRRSKILILFTV